MMTIADHTDRLKTWSWLFSFSRFWFSLKTKQVSLHIQARSRLHQTPHRVFMKFLGDCRDRKIGCIQEQRERKRRQRYNICYDDTRHLLSGLAERQLRRSSCGSCAIRIKVSAATTSTCHPDGRRLRRTG